MLRLFEAFSVSAFSYVICLLLKSVEIFSKIESYADARKNPSCTSNVIMLTLKKKRLVTWFVVEVQITVEPSRGIINPNICDGRSLLYNSSYSPIPITFWWWVNDAAILKVL